MWIQIPTPGDHYSPAYGSALITIIYEISKIHEMNGGKTRVIVGKGTRHDHDCGEIIEVNFALAPGKHHKIADTAFAQFGAHRVFGASQYSPALEAIPIDFDGVVFIHNNPVALRLIQKARPKAKICLWANNELWRAYSGKEIKNVADSIHRLICCSEYIAGDLRERIGNHEKIKVVNNGVNIEKFSPIAKTDETVPIITFIGRMVPEKGPHLILKAAQKLGNRNFKISLVGSRQFDAKDPLSDYEKSLRELAVPLGEKVEFVPAVDRFRVIEEYQKSSIFCSPAVWNDPCPLTILESLACGLPTITTKRGGIPEMGSDAALYFDPDNVDEFGAILADLLDNPKRRAEVGKRARQQAESMSWENQYNQLLNAIA